MLTQAKVSKGSTSVDAINSPRAEIPQPWPIASMRRQSASFWFQCAARESARQPARCFSPSACSILSVTRLEVGGLSEARLAARDPVGDPVDHRLERDA